MLGWRTEIEERVDREAKLLFLTNNCTDMQAAICELFLLGYTQTEIAKHFEITKQAVRYHMDKMKGILLRLEV